MPSKDLKWIEVPLGIKIAADKHPLNLANNEVLVLHDVTPSEYPGSLSLRRISSRAISKPVGDVKSVGEQNRSDGTKRYVSVSTGLGRTALYVQGNGVTFEPLWQNFINQGIDPYTLGDSGDVIVSPDVVRACGEEGLAAVVRLGTLPYMDGDIEVMPRQFRVADGRQPANLVGIGYVPWNGRVETIGARDDDGYSRNFISIETETHAVGDEADTWFGSEDAAFYFYTLVYEGGQESPPQKADSASTSGDRDWFRVTVRIINRSDIPYSVKAINVYRQKFNIIQGGSPNPDVAVLVQTCPIYKETDRYRDWERSGNGEVYRHYNGTSYFYDKNEESVIGGSYFDRQQLSSKVKDLSPNRRHQRLFSDRLFAWGVVAEDGKVYGNRLYYSHVNGLAISCFDIIPTANYVEFPFNIVGLVSARSHRIVIGDSKYAIGYFTGGTIQGWRIYEGDTEMGCNAPDSIADTPYGAAYMGYDGIYVVNGLEVTGPIARGVFVPNRDSHDWTLSRGAYSQVDQEYFLYVPIKPDRRGDPLIIAVSLKNGSVRTITAPEGNISCFGVNSSGQILVATDLYIYVLESSFGSSTRVDLPDPSIETGYRRFFGGDDYQSIAKVHIHGSCSPGVFKVTLTGYPSGTVSEIVFPETMSDEPVSVHNPNSASPDFAHKVTVSYLGKDGEEISSFRVDKIMVAGQPIEGRTMK